MKFNKRLLMENKEQYQFILEANSFELASLHKEFGAESIDKTGIVTCIGHVADSKDCPVFVHIQPYQYKDVVYLALEVSGKWADWDLIEAWAKFHFPEALILDSNNFHKITKKAGVNMSTNEPTNLQSGDVLVCIEGRSYFKFGTLFKVTDVINNEMWTAETGGETYVGWNIGRTIHMQMGGETCEFKVLPTKAMKKPLRGYELITYVHIDGFSALIGDNPAVNNGASKVDLIGEIIHTQVRFVEPLSGQAFIYHEGQFHNIT